MKKKERAPQNSQSRPEKKGKTLDEVLEHPAAGEKLEKRHARRKSFPHPLTRTQKLSRVGRGQGRGRASTFEQRREKRIEGELFRSIISALKNRTAEFQSEKARTRKTETEKSWPCYERDERTALRLRSLTWATQGDVGNSHGKIAGIRENGEWRKKTNLGGRKNKRKRHSRGGLPGNKILAPILQGDRRVLGSGRMTSGGEVGLGEGGEGRGPDQREVWEKGQPLLRSNPLSSRRSHVSVKGRAGKLGRVRPEGLGKTSSRKRHINKGTGVSQGVIFSPERPGHCPILELE